MLEATSSQLSALSSRGYRVPRAESREPRAISVKVSVIMPVERADAQRAIESVLHQEAPFDFELIAVSAAPLPMPLEAGVRNVVEPNRNPATRRNRAVSVAAGEILAFIDDDAVADPCWLATACAYLDAHPDVLALGGPDPAPDDSTNAELVSDTLLATRWIGSGVIAHESRGGVVYRSRVRRRHRGRALPGHYLRDRWRAGVKAGQTLNQRRYRRKTKS